MKVVSVSLWGQENERIKKPKKYELKTCGGKYIVEVKKKSGTRIHLSGERDGWIIDLRQLQRARCLCAHAHTHKKPPRHVPENANGKTNTNEYLRTWLSHHRRDSYKLEILNKTAVQAVSRGVCSDEIF